LVEWFEDAPALPRTQHVVERIGQQRSAREQPPEAVDAVLRLTHASLGDSPRPDRRFDGCGSLLARFERLARENQIASRIHGGNGSLTDGARSVERVHRQIVAHQHAAKPELAAQQRLQDRSG
jgi:hypothetical protein